MQGAEPLPTDSPSATAEPSSRRAAQRMVRENLHTNVLGRGDGDIESNTSIGNTTASASTNASEAKSGGWFGMFGGNSNEAEEANNVQRKRRNNNARYNGLQQSLEEGNYDPAPLEGLGSSSSVATDSLATATEATTATREDRVRQDSSIFFQGVDEESAMPYHRTKSGRKGGRTVAKSNRMLHNMAIRARLSGEVDGALFMSRYEKLNQVMDPTKRKKNKARHLRGQQYMGTDNSSDNDEHIIVFLDENDDGQSQPSFYREHIPSPTNNVVMGATSLVNPHGFRSSSMFFEQDGKMLMRLPRDQVRLVMDYNLEPGILSVEQWRSQEDAQVASEKLAARNARTKEMIQRQKDKERRHRRRERERRRRRRRKLQKMKQKQATAGESKTGDEEVPLKTVPLEESKEEPSENDYDDDDDSYSSYSDDNSSYSDDDSLDQDLLPELKYVITIPDDLYRRMVAEMSAKLMPPYWGFLKCFHQESGRADIRLALVILAVVMSLLFVGSLEWRTT